MADDLHIFDDFERTFHEPAGHGEPVFSFLNRSARPAAELVRCEITKWLAEYPRSEQPELCARMRTDFPSPFFELLLHELFRRRGALITLHPEIGTKGKKPDFLVTVSPHCPVVVEAKVSMNEEEESPGQDKRLAVLFKAIDSIKSAFFFLNIREVRDNKKPIPTRRVTDFLSRELKTFDAEQVISHYENYGDLPRLTLEHGEFFIEFELIPKRRAAWGKVSSSIIGIHPMRARWGGVEGSLRKTLRAKANRYGEIEQPFLIALNTLGVWGLTNHDQYGTLFGTGQEYVSAMTERLEFKRKANGLWGNAAKPKYTRLSAVLFGMALPWNVPRITFCLYHNPWARYPLPDLDWPFEQVKITDVGMNCIPSPMRLADVFELSENWPGPFFADGQIA